MIVTMALRAIAMIFLDEYSGPLGSLDDPRHPIHSVYVSLQMAMNAGGISITVPTRYPW